jgi:hypothetical protein
VNLNPSGSLKLNIIVEWDPLAQFYAQEVDNNSPLRKRRMIISPMTLKPVPAAHASSSSPLKKRDEEQGEEEDLVEELKENLNKLGSVLNDEIQGQYPELEMCEVNIAALRRIANQVSIVGGVVGGAICGCLNFVSLFCLFCLLFIFCLVGVSLLVISCRIYKGV